MRPMAHPMLPQRWRAGLVAAPEERGAVTVVEDWNRMPPRLQLLRGTSFVPVMCATGIPTPKYPKLGDFPRCGLRNNLRSWAKHARGPGVRSSSIPRSGCRLQSDLAKRVVEIVVSSGAIVAARSRSCNAASKSPCCTWAMAWSRRRCSSTMRWLRNNVRCPLNHDQYGVRGAARDSDEADQRLIADELAANRLAVRESFGCWRQAVLRDEPEAQ